MRTLPILVLRTDHREGTRGRFASAAVSVFAMLSLIPAISIAPWGNAARAAEAESMSEEQVDQWLLYFGPELGIYAHTGKGSSSGTLLTGPRVRPPRPSTGDLGVLVSNPERSREVVASALLGGTIGVLTPAIDVPSRPRLFIDFGVLDALTTEVQLARRGNPGIIEFPNDEPVNSPIGEGALKGVGTQIGVQHQGPQFYASLGPSFEFPLGDGQLIRIKPAVVYSRTRLDILAQTRRAVRLNSDSGVNQQLDDFRFLLFREKRTEIYHAVGPSLEIEYMPGVRWGAFDLSMFIKGNASHIFTEPKTEMQQCNVAGGQPNECARWEYTQDVWTYRVMTGVRLLWSPDTLW